MKTYFDGTLKQLQRLLAASGISGRSEQKPHGVHLLRCHQRLQVHWSSTKGTVWFSGASAPFDPRPQLICSAIESVQPLPTEPTTMERSSKRDIAASDDDVDDEDFGLEPWMYEDDDDD